jgi:hypothetical protein
VDSLVVLMVSIPIEFSRSEIRSGRNYLSTDKENRKRLLGSWFERSRHPILD